MPATPAIDPWQRIVAVRTHEHGFAIRGLDDTAGPGVVRPPFPGPGAAWAARDTDPAAGNIVWTGSTPAHTVAYNGPRSRWWGHTRWDYGGIRFCWQPWFSHNGERVNRGGSVFGAALKTFDGLPAIVTSYTGAGTGSLNLDGLGRDEDAPSGTWIVTCTTGGSLAEFRVTRPDGVAIGTARLAQSWQQGLRFTITAGGLAFQPGDEWMVKVESPRQLIVVNGGVATFGEDVFPEGWSRRPADDPTAPWTTFATLDPLPDEIGPVPQPWFISASATKAVTMRRVRPSGGSESLVAITFDLDTLQRTEAPQGYQPSGIVSTDYVDPEDPDAPRTLDAQESVSFATTQAIVGQDFIGDDLIELVDESSGSHTWEFHQTDWDWPSFAGAGSVTRSTDLVVRRAGAEIYRHPSFSDTRSCSVVIDTPGTKDDDASPSRYASVSRTTQHRPLYALDIAPDNSVTISEAGGAWGWSPVGTVYAGEEIWTCEATAVQQRHRGTVLADANVSGTYERGGNFGATVTSWLPLYFGGSQVSGDFNVYDIEGMSGLPSEQTSGPMGFPDFGAGPRAAPDFGLLHGAHAPIAGNWAPHNTERTRTAAQDTRGNYISTIEVSTVFTGNAEWSGTWFRDSGNAGSTESGGTIGLPNTGTHDLQTGGPDGLTTADLATLTGYAGGDVWDVGAF